jgi:hypothetical protein
MASHRASSRFPGFRTSANPTFPRLREVALWICSPRLLCGASGYSGGTAPESHRLPYLFLPVVGTRTQWACTAMLPLPSSAPLRAAVTAAARRPKPALVRRWTVHARPGP